MARRCRSVRKHRAPKGALRPIAAFSSTKPDWVRQKAPSAKSCIKTFSTAYSTFITVSVRKHRAPKGALILHDLWHVLFGFAVVRKHRAPKGELRLLRAAHSVCDVEGLGR